MNLAAIFALLLSTGVCSQSDFQSRDGSTLSVMVCPRVIPQTAPELAPVEPTEPKQPSGLESLSTPLQPGEKRA